MSRTRRSARRRWATQAGFTVAEVLVSLVVATILVGGILQLLIGQNRQYTKQQELIGVRGSLRAAAALLSVELRWASAANGDVYSISPNSFAARSIQGGGVICGKHPSEKRYGLASTWGELNTTADDSALIFAAGTQGAGDDAWKVFAPVQNFSPGAGGVPTCAWGGSPSPNLVMGVAGDTSGVTVGAPLRAFRRIEYGLYQEAGHWWLGRKVGGGSYERLTGPLRAPSDSGLVFTYYDQAGNTTSDATQVESVDIVLRSQSIAKLSRLGGVASELQDTLTTRVFLRN